MTLFRNNMWMLAPKFENILECFMAYSDHLREVVTCKEGKMVDPRCKDHEGGRFLTNGVAKTAVSSMLAPLRTLGSFLFWKQPSSTLSASPLISTVKGNRGKEPAYMSYPDYDADFDALCKSTRDAKVKITAEVSDFVGKSATGVACTLTSYAKFMGTFGTSKEDSKRRYDEAARLFSVLPHDDEVDGQPGDPSAPQPAPRPARTW